jgi:hypothetical protein
VKAAERSFDRLLAKAIPVAAKQLAKYGGAPSFLERYLEEALIEAIGVVDAAAAAQASGRGLVSIPNWDKRLGGFDLRLRFASDPDREALAELKIDDVEHTLWDLFKLASALKMPGVDASYLILARPRHRWNHGDCAALFADRGGPTHWVSAAMFVRWQAAWADLTGPKGGSARPTEVPAEIKTEFIGSAPTEGFEGYEIRCVSVRLIPGTDALPFNGDWPISSTRGR